ncbi:MAG: hypothetical protein M0011_02705 [Elusimicrobia bacterium]|nr:hypothetical protein [Elusimicrobiota bacterium]
MGKTISKVKVLAFLAITFTVPVSLFSQSVSTNTIRSKWSKSDSKILYLDASGRVAKELETGSKEKLITPPTATSYIEKSGVTIDGGVSSDGNYAWIDRREWAWLHAGNHGENLFQYFGPDGKLLWERNDVYGVAVSSDGELVFLLQVDPEFIETLEYGNGPSEPAVYTSTGGVVVELPDCATYQTTWYLSKNGDKATVECYVLEDHRKQFTAVYDVLKRKLAVSAVISD